MELYVIRHAAAVGLGERGITNDAERPLTERGERQAKALGLGLPKVGVQLELVLTSPLVRARQTAEGIAQQWSAGALTVEVCSMLAPDVKPRKLAKALNATGKTKLAIVGHEPSLSAWTAWLIGSRKAQLDLAKASVAYVRVAEKVGKGTGQLVWLVPPEWFLAGRGSKKEEKENT